MTDTESTAPASLGHNNPPRERFLFRRDCPECGQQFGTNHPVKSFCTPGHKVAYNNRQIAEGQRIVGLAKAWRAARSSKDPIIRQAGKDAFSDMCRELDALIADDRTRGNMHPARLFHQRQRLGLMDNNGALTRKALSKGA